MRPAESTPYEPGAIYQLRLRPNENCRSSKQGRPGDDTAYIRFLESADNRQIAEYQFYTGYVHVYYLGDQQIRWGERMITLYHGPDCSIVSGICHAEDDTVTAINKLEGEADIPADCRLRFGQPVPNEEILGEPPKDWRREHRR